MSRIVLFAGLGLMVAFGAGSQAQTSPYAGQQSRAIKALAPEDIDALLAGKGWGLAKAAELNAYPGPMHCLELAAELRLTPDQRGRLIEIRDRMTRAARALGAEVVARERELDRHFAERSITKARLEAETEALGATMGRLRAVHLSAHIETRDLLTPEQIARYGASRGYVPGAGDKSPHGHSGHRPG